MAFASSLLVTPSLVGQQNFPIQRPMRMPVRAAAAQAPLPSQVVQSPVPLPPEQMPASPPEVRFQQGQLTIMASNSTLGDILRAVRQQTGASVDVPGNATERVVGQFGPGPARDVLSSLLNGSHFNYVLLGSAGNPNALERVILTSRSGANEQLAQSASPSMAPSQPNRAFFVPPPPQPADTDDASDDSADPPDTADADEQGTPGQGDDQAQPQQPPANALGQPGGVKTPEELLQELQQRQQQTQQANPIAPGYPPTGLQRQPQ